MIQLVTSGILEQPQPSAADDWAPTDANVVAWIDASDTSSYTRSGSTLTAVTDKAGTYTMSIGSTPTVINRKLIFLHRDFISKKIFQLMRILKNCA